ncbi:DUF6071 family protein [Plantactinospora sp. B24E8]|uniref:DUF6071 family protein n=1 Tax=Plantactinospora sp. B24E8 TaxID=3153567 RepID=UPI00325C3905
MSTIRLLVANGCSFARGAELAAPERDAWPALLGADLGVRVANLGCDGGSNRRVVRSTVAHLDAVRRAHRVTYDQILFFGMWTALCRDEYYDSRIEDGPVRPDLGVRPDLPEEPHWQRVADWKAAEGDRPSRAYLKHLFSTTGGTVNFFVDWLLLEHHLTQLGVPSRYAFAWEVLPDPIPAEAVPVMRALRADLVFGQLPPRPQDTFREMVVGRVPFGHWDHPLREGHRHFANALLRWLRTDERLHFPRAVGTASA